MTNLASSIEAATTVLTIAIKKCADASDYRGAAFLADLTEKLVQRFPEKNLLFDLTETERKLVDDRQHVAAIKEVRQRLHNTLKEAKELCDAYRGRPVAAAEADESIAVAPAGSVRDSWRLKGPQGEDIP